MGTQGDPLMDGTWTCNPPGKQVVRDRRVTIHTQKEKATSKGPRDHEPYGRSPYIFPHSTSDLPYTHTKHLSNAFLQGLLPTIYRQTLNEQVSGLRTKRNLGRRGPGRKGFLFFFKPLAPLTNAAC